MNSGCSESIGSASCPADAFAMDSCHQTSRPACMEISFLVRSTTTTFPTVGHALLSSASSTAALSGTTLPRRQPPSAVMTMEQPASLMRSRSALAEKPAKTTLWGAPKRAQASMAIAASGIIGR